MSTILSTRLFNVRSHKQAEYSFVPTMNAIVGPNGSGKTTILESLYTLLRGNSFRGSLGELAQYGTNQYQIRTVLETQDSQQERSLKYLAVDSSSQKKWQVEGKSYARLPAGQRLPVVLFEPDLARLITGGPQRRRDYLDHIVGQLNPELAVAQNRLERTLRQRNQLLKTLHGPSQDLFVWNTQLAQLSELVVAGRLKLLEQLRTQVSNHYRQLGGQTEVVLSYQSDVGIEPDQYGSRLLQFLETSLPRDIALGYTSFGPHRDDIEILLADQPARERASRGEVRTAVIALKLLETDLLAQHYVSRKITPILLLDDVLSELDLNHQEQVLAGFKDYQVFITTTDAHALTPGTHTIGLD